MLRGSSGYVFLLRSLLRGGRSTIIAALAGSTAPTASQKSVHGQSFDTEQPGVYANSGAATPGDLIALTTDGALTWDYVLTGPGPGRVGLSWTAGARGKPGINGDINSATEGTREIADPDFEILGTNGVSACATFNAEGGLTLTTTTGSADQVILAPHLDANQSAWSQWTWGTDRSVRWSCTIATSAAITAQTIWAGLKLTNTSTTATDDNQVFFRYQNGVNTGKWQAINSIGGTDVATDSGVTVAVSTVYRLAIVISSARIAKLYINDVLVATTGALTDTTDLIPYIGIETGTTAAKSINVYGQKISRAAA